MTAYISRVYPDRVEVMFDTACFLPPDMTLVVGIYPKAMQCGAMPLVITGRGSLEAIAEYGMKLGGSMSNSGDVDDALTSFESFLSEQKRSGRTFGTEQDYLIAGWSKKLGFFHRHIATGKFAEMLGAEPFEMREISAFWAGGPFDDQEYLDTGIYTNDFDAGLSVHGVKLMNAFRNKPTFPNGPDDPVFMIGGQLLLLTIRQDTVETKSLGYWPDLLFERIKPGGFVRVNY